MRNALYYGDNLTVLKESVAAESVDLIYLDPPFNSNASYNVLFKAPSGEGSQAQIEAFEDTWHWNDSAEKAFDEVVIGAHSDASIMLRAMRSALGENDMMAYLAMMAVRLIELHRVLKPSGSLYLHCDPVASHYLKVLLDSIFGREHFVNEIIWKRSDAKGDASGQGAKHFGRVNDTLLLYFKGDDYVFNPQFSEMEPNYIERWYRHQDTDGRRYKLDNMLGPGGAAKGNPFYEVMGVGRYWRYSRERMGKLISEGRVIQTRPGTVPMYKRYLDETKGVPLTTNWADIRSIHGWAHEKLGYPTQKPIALLERIVSTSSNKIGVVLDPFCGCGTAVHAAQKLGRKWIGIDVTHLAIALIERRLKEAFPSITFDVRGVPKDHAGAHDLADRDKHEFQKWITATIGAQPYKSGKKGMDRGIDGYLHFRDADKQPQFAIISVKGGGTKSGDVRDLKGTMEREKAAMGLFLTLNEPTREMEREAASAGMYETGGMKVPRLQILTAAQILDNRRPQVPFGFTEGFKKAAREETSQDRLL